jgi:hypothetical protein
MFYLFLLGILLCSSIESLPSQIIHEESRSKKKIDPHVDKNPLWTSFQKKVSRPYLIGPDHPLRKSLDNLFRNRPTYNRASLEEAGFVILCHRPRSYIYVASHPLLPGYLFKIYVDTELKIKDKIPGWRWFVYRCEGRFCIDKTIKKKKLHLLTVPWKGIYPLPNTNIPPKSAVCDPKHTVLVVERMDLVPKEENLRLWKESITKDQLRELYTIVKNCSSIRTRPDNIHFTTKGTLAIIDTEYPNRDPDYVSLPPYLSPDMARFWQKLTK